MNNRRANNSRGSVVLVSLCFVAVLGIALASYLAICNQAMRLSDRSTQRDLSAQLAETGLERALWSFNQNDWSGWTISGNTATRTIAFSSSKYGTVGVTGSFNLRVDNYNAFHRSSTWSSATTYSRGDTVGYNGVWYSCLKRHSNQLPTNMNYWIPEGVPWEWNESSSYSTGDMAHYDQNWYRYIAGSSSTNRVPATETSYWKKVNGIYTSTPGSWPYTPVGEEVLLYSGGTWARLSHTTWDMFPIISWRWRSGVAQKVDDVIYLEGAWYRCMVDHTSAAWPSHPAFGTTYWQSFDSRWSWSASHDYPIGSTVSRGGKMYRALRANTNQAPPSAEYWSDAPLLSHAWQSGRKYPLNDVVEHDGIWYRCIVGDTAEVPTNSTYWRSASQSTASTWSASASYASGDYVSYGNIWYRCVSAHSNKSPNLSAYWTAVNAPVIYAEGVATPVSGSPLRTQIRANVALASAFPNAISSTSTLSLNSSSAGGIVDSYDHDLADYDAATAGYSAILAAQDETGIAVTITGGTVKGYVAAPSYSTAPFAPRWAYGGGVVLTGGTATGIDSSRVSRSPYVPRYDIRAVSGATSLSSLTIGVPGASIPAVYKISSSADLNNDDLYIVGPVILDIQGDLRIRSNSNVIVASTGSAEIHFSGRLTMAGRIENKTLDPKKFILVGSGVATSAHTWTGAAAFHGALYLPNTTSTLTFSGNSPGFYGALAAGPIVFSNEANFHYDRSLNSANFRGIDQPVIVSEWRELTSVLEKVTF